MRIFSLFFFILFVSVSTFATGNSVDSVRTSKKGNPEIEKISKKVGFNLEDDYSTHIPLYSEAIKWLGVRYRRAGMSLKGVDCSGLTSVIYKNVFNKQLQRSSIDISRSIDEEITKDDLQPGDLVFFATRGKKIVNHVGVFLGDRKFIHASVGRGVVISSLDEAYYKRTWKKGGRVKLEEYATRLDIAKIKSERESLFSYFKNITPYSAQNSEAQSQFESLKDQNIKHPILQ